MSAWTPNHGEAQTMPVLLAAIEGLKKEGYREAELDTALTPALQAVADSILGDGKYRPGYNRTFFAGVGHGFAVRANLSDPVAKAAKEGAFFAAVEWLRAHD
ncbi:hypothetical protein C0991_004347 [Blastosporella zonata]|nr:hypothetical protein C0991_004347 [Blastosporella zonata]